MIPFHRENCFFFNQRRNLGNIRRYEYVFFAVGLIAALVTDGLTLARLVQLGSLEEPDFAYGILIIINSGRKFSFDESS